MNFILPELKFYVAHCHITEFEGDVLGTEVVVGEGDLVAAVVDNLDCDVLDVCAKLYY